VVFLFNQDYKPEWSSFGDVPLLSTGDLPVITGDVPVVEKEKSVV
jgi:hypothetical protein